MIEITCNDRLGKKVRVKCNSDDTIGDLKKLIAAQTGTRWDKIVLKKWYTIFKDHIKLEDYEIHDGMNLELYYQWPYQICADEIPKNEMFLGKSCCDFLFSHIVFIANIFSVSKYVFLIIVNNGHFYTLFKIQMWLDSRSAHNADPIFGIRVCSTDRYIDIRSRV